ncbi:MAG: extracellular solute-binding protein [Lachnospiraceae bacterium]|nr:extracellular solute-binding protein [Lachnospiraceae bacterium]
MKMLTRKEILKAAAVTGSGLAAMGLVGCSSSGSSSESASSETSTEETSTGETTASESTEEVAETVVEKPEKISWMVHDGLSEENGTDQWVEEFESLTGIDMDLQVVSNNEYYELLELAFASDEVPDVFDLDADHYGTYASKGAIADLTELLQNSEMYEKLDEELLSAFEMGGKYYGLARATAGGSVTYARQDWLDRVGMDIPTTYDEFIDMLRAFRDEIEECVVPLTAAGLTTPTYLPEFLQGANMNITKVDGVWVDGMLEDNMVTALGNLQSAYAEGLIDMEIVTNSTSNCRDQLYAGTVGVFNYWNGTWYTRLKQGLAENFPDAELVAIPAIEGSNYLYQTISVWCINGQLDDDTVASLFKYFLEYMNDGGEGQKLFCYGVEGVHYEQGDENITYLQTLSDPNTTLAKVWTSPDTQIIPFTDAKDQVALDEDEEYTRELLAQYAVAQSMMPISETYTKISSDLTLLKEETMAKVVMGDMTVEEGLAYYRENAEALGIEQVLEELNAG